MSELTLRNTLPRSPDRLSVFNDSTVSAEWRGYGFGSLAAFIWGCYLAFSSVGVNAGLDAFDLAFLRYVPAGLVLAPWFLRHDPLRLSGIGWFRGLSLVMLAGPLFVLTGSSGFGFAPLAHSAVIQLGTVTLAGILLSVLMLKERLGIAQVIGIAAMIAGLAITAGPGLLTGGSQAWKGDLLFIAAGLMWALFTVLQRRWRVDPLGATAVVSALSALAYGSTYLILRGPNRILSIDPLLVATEVAVLGVLAGVVALFAFGRAVSLLGAGRAALFPALSPAVAILAGIPLTGATPSAGQVAGLLALTTGLLVAMQRVGAK